MKGTQLNPTLKVILKLLLLIGCGCLPAAELKRDESIILYPTIGKLAPNGLSWELNVQGRIFEPERRGITLAAFRRGLGLADIDLSPESMLIFNERARAFLADNERGKIVALQARNHTFTSGKSDADGHFIAKFNLPAYEVTDGRSVRVATAFRNGRQPVVTDVFLLSPSGLSVISDVDDTIKVSEVTNKKALLRNTFLRPYQPVPGMAALYQSWASNSSAQFHYVSASPWQLYEPLADFTHSNGFPAGSFHLKSFRVKDRSFFGLFASPVEYKLSVIEPLLKRFPNRQFVLVGDSGEKDPEVYARLARDHPRQIAMILIRDLSGDGPDSVRYRTVFQKLPPAKWRLFRDPREISDPLKLHAP